MNRWKYWLSKFRESTISTMPIAIVIIAFFLIERFLIKDGVFDESLRISNDDIIIFSVSVGMIIIGMGLFSLGTEESMTEIGRIIGGSLKAKKNFFFIVAMTFILGVLVTVAEPDLAVLSGQIGIQKEIIIWTIGVGVGLFLVIGVLRVMFRKNLNLMFLAFYALVFVLCYLIDPRFLPICFDSGGVTTGPVTVPFLLGFGMGMAASHGGRNSEDSFGLTALCSVGPILSVVIISAIMRATGQELPSTYADPLAALAGTSVWQNMGSSFLHATIEVAISVGPILAFFLVYELIFIRLPLKTVLRVLIGMVATYIGLVCFLASVSYGFMPIASKVGQSLGSLEGFPIYTLILGALFGVFGVLAEPAVHVLVHQIEEVSDGAIKGIKVLLILAGSIGVAVVLQIIRAYYRFPIIYYLVPGYIIVFALSFGVPKIYTAMAFDSGGVASGPMTSTFVLPFCIGFAYAQGADPYLYGFGLVAMVAMMPLIVLQLMGLEAVGRRKRALAKARRRLVMPDDEQVIHLEEAI